MIKFRTHLFLTFIFICAYHHQAVAVDIALPIVIDESSGTFRNPVGGTINDGIGTSTFLSGDKNLPNGTQTRLSYSGLPRRIGAVTNEPFEVGFVEVSNGFSVLGSTASRVTLTVLMSVIFNGPDPDFFATDQEEISIINNSGLLPEWYATLDFPHAIEVPEFSHDTFPIIGVIESSFMPPVEAATTGDIATQQDSPQFQFRLLDFGEPLNGVGQLIDNPIPEPNTLILQAIGLLSMYFVARKR